MSTLKTISLQHLNGASPNIYLGNTGNVGIGNSSPTTKLSVDGEAFFGRADSSVEGGEIKLARSSDNLAHYSIDCYGGSTTPSMRFIDNVVGAVRMGIDSSGRVTKPYQPMFYAQHNATGQASNRYGYFSGEWVNQGGHASHGQFNAGYMHTRFTCPVAGKYMVWLGNIGNASGTTQRSYVYKNGSTVSNELRTAQTGNHGTGASLMTIVDCAANDWLACLSLADDNSSGFYAGIYSHMGVLLIG